MLPKKILSKDFFQRDVWDLCALYDICMCILSPRSEELICPSDPKLEIEFQILESKAIHKEEEKRSILFRTSCEIRTCTIRSWTTWYKNNNLVQIIPHDT